MNLSSAAKLKKLAVLLKQKNRIDQEIAGIIGRPSLTGHIGEYIASNIFRIKLANSATTKGIDGVFRDKSLKGNTVNIKLYPKRENSLDIARDNLADYYLVLTGPKTEPTTSRGHTRPLVISNVYLFKMRELVAKLRVRGLQIGIATSIANCYWVEAEIYPNQTNNNLQLTVKQKNLLKLFTEN